jgi:hypothetical protein
MKAHLARLCENMFSMDLRKHVSTHVFDETTERYAICRHDAAQKKWNVQSHPE